ncbi:patatin-like phospholipase family protein [Tessaracoccus caeni]|uniref:patatin-like phospholipase family protein n=1 Tax=Tessaracoccus caeni TaxID=3031239 RepID=UPI0023DB5431|nr:patatin family protein [Tessaracoccus caeni]MDF1487839.1 patatin family protein [Tessaracoccus caeni]
MDLTSNVTDTALIFEGGGMRATYSSGVLAGLLEADVHVDWAAGISAGSSCLANYVTRDATRARRTFVEFSAEPRFGNWRTWLRGKGVFNSEWIYEQTSAPDQALPYDWQAFLDNPMQFRVGGYRCEDGAMIYWGRDDIHTMLDLMKRVRASSTMPVLMPLTTVDGEVFCDGALGPTGGIALDAAQTDGYEKFLVVHTRERSYRKQPVRTPRGMRALFRRYPAIADGLIARAANYNRTLEELLELEKQGRAYLVFPDSMPIKNSERNLAKLGAMFDAGFAQARREAPAIREFLGLS